MLDLKTGDIKNWIRFNNIAKEIYDIQIVPGVKKLRIEEYTANALGRSYSVESSD